MRLWRPGAAAVMWLFCSPVPAAGNPWVCVPGAAGRWRCGHDEHQLEAEPLAAPETATRPTFVPVDSPYSKPRLPWQPNAKDLSRPGPTPGPMLQTPGATASDPAPAGSLSGGFVLRLVSVSAEHDVRAFVEDFDIDPERIRYARVTEDEHQRFLILYGGYDSQADARFAIAALPPAMRAIQPQPVAISSLANPLTSLQAGASEPAPTKPLITTGETPRDSNAPGKDQTQPNILALAVVQPPPATAEPAKEMLDEVEVAVLAEPEAVAPETLVIASEAAPGPPQTARSGNVPSAPAQGKTGSHATIAEDSGAAEPALVLDLSITSPAAATDHKAAEPAAGIRPITAPKPKRAAAVATTGDPARFSSIASEFFTLQLSSQRSEQSAERFIGKHGLERDRCHLVLIDEGAGQRWLVLYSQFPDLALANASKDLIPSGIRSPWARRVAPLQLNMVLSK